MSSRCERGLAIAGFGKRDASYDAHLPMPFVIRRDEITQDVREYAAQKEIDEQAALGVGMKEKAEEFVAAGGELYQVSRT